VLLAGLTEPGEVGEVLALYRLKSLSLDYKALIFTWNFVSTNLQKFAVTLLYQQIKPSLLLEYNIFFFFFRYRTGVVADCFKFCWCYTYQAHTDVVP
jgi:hypothetical protein